MKDEYIKATVTMCRSSTQTKVSSKVSLKLYKWDISVT